VSGEPDRQNRLILFDRDGTLNVPVDRYVLRAADLELLPGAAVAVAPANRVATVALVTNQQGVGRGLLSLDALEAIHDRLGQLLDVEGGHLDAVYVCPHLVDTCECRKPLDGLFRRALADHPRIAPSDCAMIGDQPSDVVPALSLGMAAFLVCRPGEEHRAPEGATVVGSALEAAQLLAAGRGWRRS
jgi:D-glycero-D-manno-heptose 1,7-bisphosphate phosphatase